MTTIFCLAGILGAGTNYCGNPAGPGERLEGTERQKWEWHRTGDDILVLCKTLF